MTEELLGEMSGYRTQRNEISCQAAAQMADMAASSGGSQYSSCSES